MDIPFLVYGIGLTVAVLAASLTVYGHPDWRLARATLALLFNWVAGTVFVMATETTDAWSFNIAIDVAAAAVILYRLAGRWQIALGLTYCLQIAMHVVYALSMARSAAHPWPYYSALTAIAWLQILLVLGWSFDVWLRAKIKRSERGKPGNAEPALDPRN
jgi:hypothetical protein